MTPLRLKSLEIQGFKSFVDRTLLHFPEGVTCVVGPNGCGKSNIADAIAWVLGEQSARNLRGQKMGDVIFAGSTSRKAAGYAEVTMEWERLVHPEEQEDPSAPRHLRISRKLWRNGESEYLLDDKAARLKDIQDALLDFGLGTKSYSLIEQGHIGNILNAKPQERRALLEEAAGVLKYKLKKQETAIRLKHAEDKLLRLDDILKEIQKQRNALNRQVGKARRFRLLKGELRHLEFRWVRCLLEQKEIQAASLTALKEEQSRVFQQMSRQREDQRLQKEALTQRVSLLTQALETSKSQVHQAEKALAQLEKDLEVNAAETSNRESTIAQWHVTADQHVLQKQQLLEELQQKTEEQKRIEEKLAEYDGLHRGAQEMVHTFAHRLKTSKNETSSLQSQCEQHRLHLERLRLSLDKNQTEQKERQQARLDHQASSQALVASVDDLQAQIVDLTAQCADLKNRLQQQTQALLEAQDALKTQRLAEQALREQRQEIKNRWQRQEAELQTMERLLRQGADLGEAHRQMIQATRGELALCRDYLSPLPRWAEALSWSLAPLLASFVFLTEDQKRAHLPRFAGTGLAYLDLTVTWPEAVLCEAPSDVINVFQTFSFQPQAPDALKDALASLLAPCYFSAKRPDPVASAGLQVFCHDHREEWRGSWVRCHPKMAEEQPSYFHWRDEEKRLRGEIDENARLWQAIETRLTSQTAALKGCSDHQHACQQEQTHLKESLARLEAALQQKFLLQEQHRERLRREEQWSQGHQKRLQELADQQSRLVQELKDVEALLATKQSTAATQQALLEELESQYRREEHKTLQLQQGHQQLREWLQRLSGELKRSHERLSQLDKEEQAQKKRQEQYLEERERLKNRHEVLVRAHALRMQEVAEGKQKTALQEKDLQPLVAQLAEGSAQGESLHGSLMDAQAALGRLELAEARLEADLLHLREKFQGLHTTPRGEEVPPPLEESELEGAQARINQLKRQLSELGSVNLLAIEEFEEIDQRYQFLQHQHRDLVESIAEIRRTIQTLNRQSAKQFSETFLAVNALFGEVFQELFGGGTARMELVDPEQINESGIDLIIQPPGKKLQNALLMSGGEKALTAIALLFAIFAYRPSPFCLLDEVDAPLDESNVSRLAAKLKSLRQQTQFIIITHHKTTMNIAESLVGVTMEETGCSKIVSVQFSD